jgi:deoxyribodipyrimidine photolyase-related protein
MPRVDTVWVLGDQLNRDLGALRGLRPGDARILVVESRKKLTSRRWHRQRAHLVLTAMRRFVQELREAGFEVDHRVAPSLPAGLSGHRAEHQPDRVVAMEPASWEGRRMLERHGVVLQPTTQFLCHPDEFAAWAASRRQLKMEDFYRWQRRRLGVLMDGEEPAGGRWNFDDQNREPPPRPGTGPAWPEPLRTPLDDLDHAVLADLPPTCVGAPPDGLWATSRAHALDRLHHAVTEVLPRFGPHEDAMLTTSWHLAHTLLSPYLNLGLLVPGEVVQAAEEAYRSGTVPIASAEGFVRQVIGWREYVWGVYWLRRPEYRVANHLDAHRPLPPAFTGEGGTTMRCLQHVLAEQHDHGWNHHIQRLMVLGNLALLAGMEPSAVTDWMWERYVDGAEWVMLPNVVGMALHADGGRMATKPYAAGGAYINRMSDYCRGCRYDRSARTGSDACPFTTLYWDFLARHHDRFARNPRMGRQVQAAQRLTDLPAVRERAAEVLGLLDAGAL